MVQVLFWYFSISGLFVPDSDHTASGSKGASKVLLQGINLVG